MIDRRLTRRPTLSHRWECKKDPQRHRFYSMERTIVAGSVKTITSPGCMDDIVRHACREWKVPVAELGVETRSRVYGSSNVDGIYLNPNYDGHNTLTLLHELAHWIQQHIWPGSEDHGPEFASIFLELLDRYNYMPRYATKAMYDHWGIRTMALD